MPTLSVRNLGKYGQISDRPDHAIAANAFTALRNIRSWDGDLWTTYGHKGVLGAPITKPYYLTAIDLGSGPIWTYCGLTKIGVKISGTDWDITRAAGPYTGGLDDRWNHCELGGGVIIFNNGLDLPQVWISPAGATPLVNLTNFPSTQRAKVIRSFNRRLIAMNITRASVELPQLLAWSNQADLGAVPTTWDGSDKTKTAGEYPLLESDGACVDGLALGTRFFVYKQDQTIVMSEVGGVFVFDIKTDFRNVGILAQDCVIELNDRHVLATPVDVVYHNGSQIESLLDGKMRRWYTKSINPDAAHRSFMKFNEAENEIWVCIPTGGASWPDQALIINKTTGALTTHELPSPSACANEPIDAADGQSYDSFNIPIDEMQGTFGERTYNPGKKRLIWVVPDYVRNGVKESSDISNAAYTLSNASASGSLVNPRGGANLKKLVEDGSTHEHYVTQAIAGANFKAAQTRYVAFCDFKSAERSFGFFEIVTSLGAARFVFNSSTGSISSLSGSGVSAVESFGVDVSEGIATPWMVITKDLSSNVSLRCGLATSLIQTSYAGDGSSGAYIGNFSIREGSSRSIFQVTGDYRAVGGFLLQDEGFLRDGETFEILLEKLGFVNYGLDRDGMPTGGQESTKVITEMWVYGKLLNGEAVEISVGGQERDNSQIYWEPAQQFLLGEQDKIDPCIEGRLLAFRWRVPKGSATRFKLTGYDVKVEPVSTYSGA